jgi:hypothetical protein
LHHGGANFAKPCFSKGLAGVKEQRGETNNCLGRARSNSMEKLARIFEMLARVFVGLMALAIVGSFVMLVYAHISALNHKEYYQSFASHETIFIATLTLALMIVLIIPHIINKGQIKRSIEQEMANYWNDKHQKDMKQFISKSERDYAHISRTIAYLLQQKEHYYWSMAWAGDSVISYIKCFKEHHGDFLLNKEYFKFSLNIMKISFNEREEGKFLEDNFYLESYNNNKKTLISKSSFDVYRERMNKIKKKIYNGEKIDKNDKDIETVKELKRIILRYIKWQCIIDIEVQEHKLPNDIIELIRKHLTFKMPPEKMIKNFINSFYVDENNNEKVDEKQFIYDIVEKVELKKDKDKVRKHLKKIINTGTSSNT